MENAHIMISIITVNLNNEKGLSATIQSVLPHLSPEIEFIIIDGDSKKDNSVLVIGQIKERLSYWCSEKDNGLYDAMNKGIIKAKGKYLFFLNSGDILLDREWVKKLTPFIENDPDIISSRIIITPFSSHFFLMACIHANDGA